MRPSAHVTRLLSVLIPCCVILALSSSGCRTGATGEETAFSQLGDTNVIGGASEELHPGDMLVISFRGPATIQIPDHSERVPESGQITLPYIGKVDVVGKTRVKLQDEIHDRYVPKIFKELTVTIAPGDRFFFVYGEVKFANRYPYGSRLTVTGAISTAQGFSDFANQRKVLLIRTDGRRELVDCKKAREDPKYDPEVLPGDRIYVPRRNW
jgi:protein involved in polysaccharide export with SLBB domain